MMKGILLDRVKASNGLDRGSHRLRNQRVAVHRHALLAVDVVIMQFGLKCAADIGCGAAKSDKNAAGSDPANVQPLGRKPVRECLNILLGETEALTDLGRS